MFVFVRLSFCSGVCFRACLCVFLVAAFVFVWLRVCLFACVFACSCVCARFFVCVCLHVWLSVLFGLVLHVCLCWLCGCPRADWCVVRLVWYDCFVRGVWLASPCACVCVSV